VIGTSPLSDTLVACNFLIVLLQVKLLYMSIDYNIGMAKIKVLIF